MAFTKRTLLERMRTANKFYMLANENEKARIMEAMEHTFDCLESLGVDRSYGVLFVLYGDEFTRFEFGRSMEDLINAERL